MKIKKALKKLEKIEELVSDLIEQLASVDLVARTLLMGAHESVTAARDMLSSAATPKLEGKNSKGQSGYATEVPRETGEASEVETPRAGKVKGVRSAVKKRPSK